MILLVAIAVLPVSALSYWTVQALDRYFLSSTQKSLEGLARAKAQAIEQFTTDRVRQVERLATLVVEDLEKVNAAPESLPEMATGALPDPSHDAPDTEPRLDAGVPDGGEAESVETRPPKPAQPKTVDRSNRAREAQQSLRKTLGLIQWDQQDYEEFLVIDPKGVVLVSTFDAHEGKTAEEIEYFQQGLRTTYVQPVFLSPITERLTMVVATPIKNSSQRVIGVLAARLNLDTFFRLIGDLTGLGETGETVVGRQDGSEVLFMAPTRHDPEAALKRRLEIGSSTARPIQEASRGQAGSGPAVDYRGNEVYAAWENVPALKWGLVVKIDANESRQSVAEAREQVFSLMLVMLALILLTSIALSKAMVAPLRQLKVATDKISRGDLDVSLSINSNDEVGELADSFERMVAAIKFFKNRDSAEEELEDEERP